MQRAEWGEVGHTLPRRSGGPSPQGGGKAKAGGSLQPVSIRLDLVEIELDRLGPARDGGDRVVGELLDIGGIFSAQALPMTMSPPAVLPGEPFRLLGRVELAARRLHLPPFVDDPVDMRIPFDDGRGHDRFRRKGRHVDIVAEAADRLLLADLEGARHLIDHVGAGGDLRRCSLIGFGRVIPGLDIGDLLLDRGIDFLGAGEERIDLVVGVLGREGADDCR